jgi:hypothetical protein
VIDDFFEREGQKFSPGTSCSMTKNGAYADPGLNNYRVSYGTILKGLTIFRT